MSGNEKWVAVWIDGERLPLFGQMFKATFVGQPMVRIVGEGTDRMIRPSLIKRFETVRADYAEVFGKCEPEKSFDSIQHSVAAAFGIPETAMRAAARPQHIAVPRMVAMYLCRSIMRCSLSLIGEAFGGRDHTTVMHACKTVENKMSIDCEFAAKVKVLHWQLSGNKPVKTVVARVN